MTSRAHRHSGIEEAPRPGVLPTRDLPDLVSALFNANSNRDGGELGRELLTTLSQNGPRELREAYRLALHLLAPTWHPLPYKARHKVASAFVAQPVRSVDEVPRRAAQAARGCTEVGARVLEWVRRNGSPRDQEIHRWTRTALRTALHLGGSPAREVRLLQAAGIQHLGRGAALEPGALVGLLASLVEALEGNPRQKALFVDLFLRAAQEARDPRWVTTLRAMLRMVDVLEPLVGLQEAMEAVVRAARQVAESEEEDPREALSRKAPCSGVAASIETASQSLAGHPGAGVRSLKQERALGEVA